MTLLEDAILKQNYRINGLFSQQVASLLDEQVISCDFGIVRWGSSKGPVR
jgi:hypothetical protein